MNRNSANAKLSALCPNGIFKGANWFGPMEAVLYFHCGFARNPVADFGLSGHYNSGREIEVRVTVTDRHTLRALRRIQRSTNP